MGELTLQRKSFYINSTVRKDLHKVSGPIRIKLKSYFQGKLFIFRANCYFQGKLLFSGQIFSAPSRKMPSRTPMIITTIVHPTTLSTKA